MKHIVIIGNGISGITAARNIRKKNDNRITVISEESPFFFSRTALMYVFMGHMKFEHTQPYENDFWEKNKIDLLHDTVLKVDPNQKSVLLKTGKSLQYDDLIIATGSKSNKFGWPGQDLDGVQGLYHKQDLEKLTKSYKTIKRAVIVGGGLIGIELAEMLLSKNIEVTMLVREKSFWNGVLPNEESAMINELIKLHHIDLQLNTELIEIKDSGTGKVKSIVTSKNEEIECQLVGLTVGVTPNIDFLKDSGIEIERGVLVNEFLETNVANVYAIGDCAQHRTPTGGRKPIEQVWYTGRIMGETVANSICGNRSDYQPGIWFNSAKFFDVEYQTYGWVWAKPKENEATFFWKSKNEFKSLRLIYDKIGNHILGVNVFGIRLRHEVFDQWIQEKKNIEYVIDNLKTANFDPEFFKHHEAEIKNQFDKSTVCNLI
ncbi:MAG: FAD/NAD(P)-binding oxidoreductase [Paludibacter sp.]|nr:FAD/NAD(P)-binding oxidoreductase [Paludibacter sp.]